jgi:peptidyl-prolyl cis-trans isomerase C
VQTQYGWHIIQLEDVRDLKIPPLDEIKPQLTQRLQQQALKQLVDDLRDKVKIE